MSITSFLSLRRNNRAVSSIFAMVFFLLIVMIMFTSFAVILNQNTSLEQKIIQTRQSDIERLNEQLTITAQPTVGVFSDIGSNSITVNCNITNTGTQLVQIVRLWVVDLNSSESGSLAISNATQGSIQAGQSKDYSGKVSMTIEDTENSFLFWFETDRGNKFTLQENGSVDLLDFSSMLSRFFGDFLPDYHSVQWAYVTTEGGVSTTGPWNSGWIVPTGSNNEDLAFRLNVTYYGGSTLRIDNDTNILFSNLQETSIIFEGSSGGVFPTLYITNYESDTNVLNSYNGHEITVEPSTNPKPITLYFSTVQKYSVNWWAGTIQPSGSPIPTGYPIENIQPNAMMTLVLYGMSPSNYAQSFPLFSIQSRPISLQLSTTQGPIGTSAALQTVSPYA